MRLKDVATLPVSVLVGITCVWASGAGQSEQRSKRVGAVLRSVPFAQASVEAGAPEAPVIKEEETGPVGAPAARKKRGATRPGSGTVAVEELLLVEERLHDASKSVRPKVSIDPDTPYNPFRPPPYQPYGQPIDPINAINAPYDPGYNPHERIGYRPYSPIRGYARPSGQEAPAKAQELPLPQVKLK